LSSLITSAGGRAGTETDLPIYSVTKHSGFVPSLEYFKKQVFSRNVSGYKLVKPGDFAYATIHLDEGSIGIAPERGLVSPMYTVFRPDEQRVDPNFLIRFLKSPRALAHYPQLGKGAVHRRKSISLSALGTLSIPLPPLPEQRRIAAILDHADALRAKRRQVLAHLDSLTQSIFHDMFGIPDLTNSGTTFGSVADLAGGRNLVADDSSSDSTFRVLKISAVTSGQFRPLESKPLPADYVPPAEHLVREGDLLMSRANTTELVGAVAYVPADHQNLALPDKIWRFAWKCDAEPLFYHALFSNPTIRRRISQLSSGTGGSMKNVSKAKLKAMPIPSVGLNSQREFVQRVRILSDYRQSVNIALATDDELFASLQSRAFQGEL